MEFLILIALIALIYIVYQLKVDLSNHQIRAEAQLQRITEVIVKNEGKQGKQMIKLVGETWYQNPDKSREKNTKNPKFQTIPYFSRKMQLFQTNPVHPGATRRNKNRN